MSQSQPLAVTMVNPASRRRAPAPAFFRSTTGAAYAAIYYLAVRGVPICLTEIIKKEGGALRTHSV